LNINKVMRFEILIHTILVLGLLCVIFSAGCSSPQNPGAGIPAQTIAHFPDKGIINASAGWIARYHHSSVVMPDGSIVLMGGELKGVGGPFNDVWQSADMGVTWTLMNANAGWQARESQSSVVMPDGSIVLMGGNFGNTNFSDVWRSTNNGATWTRMTANAGWSARGSHSSGVMPDGSIVLMGGWSTKVIMRGPKDSVINYNDVWKSIDNGATWTLVNSGAGWSARHDQSTVVMPDGGIILMGGEDFNGRLNDVWRSADQGATWTRVNVSAGWIAREGHSSVVMPDGSIVLMGGANNLTLLFNDVWRSTDRGTTWILINANASWPVRKGHTSVVLPDSSIVLMGGVNNVTIMKDVWRSTDYGATWTLVNASA
jgi:hypothetical protein